ncbi:MAG TPA: aminotransferase [Gammaproteobacteria bacterium]|nr:aminotransferase [Gammaproteobacteria bacterium]
MTNLRFIDHTHQLVASQVATARISAIKEMAMLSAKVPDAASLAWGLPSFRTPAHIREAVSDALTTDAAIGKYALPDGLKKLRELSAVKHANETQFTVDPDEEVMITAGNMQAVSLLLTALLNPGDEVILTNPGFASHFQQIRIHGGEAVPWPLNESQGWSLNTTDLPNLITARTKAIILVSPSNPTGTLFTREDLEKVAAIAVQHGLFIILDDPYSAFCYPGEKDYFNLATVASIQEQLAYCYTFSKCHAMSGWRLGYMILPSWLKQHVLKVHDANMICTPRISQVAGMTALNQAPTHTEEFRSILDKRRNLICERLDALSDFLSYVPPDGAYYVFPQYHTEHKDSWDFALDLLRKAKVTVTPGSAFGSQGENHVRMAYCVEEETINLAFDRMSKHFGYPA